MPNHMTDIDPESLVAPEEREQVRGRAIVVRKFKPLPIEAIVRGYIIGTGWKDYQKTGAVCGIKLPEGLKEAQKLPEVIFTPSTKAAVGEHDQNISFEKMKEIVGADVAEKVRDLAVTLYKEAAGFAATKGILIADTKFEFGIDENRNVYLIDESHAGFLAFLACRPVMKSVYRLRHSTSNMFATGWKPSRGTKKRLLPACLKKSPGKRRKNTMKRYVF